MSLDQFTDPVSGAPMLPPDSYRPKRRAFKGQRERVFADIFRAAPETTPDVPAPALVERVYALAWHRGRAVVVRHGDADRPWEIPIVDFDPEVAPSSLPAGADPAKNARALERRLKPILRERWGFRLSDWFQHSRLTMTALSEHSTLPAGEVRYHLVLCCTLSGLQPPSKDAGWARRSLTTRDLHRLLREHYPEMADLLTAAHDAYLVHDAQAG